MRFNNSGRRPQICKQVCCWRSKIASAVKDLRKGKIIIVVDDEDRENEGDLVCAAEFATPKIINFMASEGRGLICAPISNEISQRLELCSMVENNNESEGCNFTVSVDYKHGTKTGISAFDRARTVAALINPASRPNDFRRPGHMFPLVAKDGGVLVRAGHTEAAVDLMRLANLQPAAVICEILWINGEMCRGNNLMMFAKAHELKIISIRDLIKYRISREKLVEKKVETDLETEYGKFRIMVYKDKISGKNHIVLVKGKISGLPVLVRVHSECVTSEIFKSVKCDCASQLDAAMRKIASEGGVLLYLRQEGRGIGLINKLRAYDLQKKGHDTVEANQLLGLSDDLREYGIGAQILRDIGIKKMILMTNNPRKIIGLEGFGLQIIDRMAIEIAPTKHTRGYLKIKKLKLGHLLNLVDEKRN
ncbi:3,4-dihydroxy-2-butanone-4-phosphate synthase [Candidatus Peregrinibacteria bacterium]|nr:3,4-dihydroxy-2-butanone-4-phosphate synthase [Candidatus Peregrinibacteria bacterium]